MCMAGLGRFNDIHEHSTDDHRLMILALGIYDNYLEENKKEILKHPYDLVDYLETKIIVEHGEVQLYTSVEKLMGYVKNVIEKKGKKFRTIFI